MCSIYLFCVNILNNSDLPFEASDPEITNLYELNAAQIEKSIEYINNGNINTYTSGINPFIWLGDMNIGKLQTDEYFSIFEETGQFVDMSDLRFDKNTNGYDALCTWCAIIGNDDFNILISQDPDAFIKN